MQLFAKIMLSALMIVTYLVGCQNLSQPFLKAPDDNNNETITQLTGRILVEEPIKVEKIKFNSLDDLLNRLVAVFIKDKFESLKDADIAITLSGSPEELLNNSSVFLWADAFGGVLGESIPGAKGHFTLLLPPIPTNEPFAVIALMKVGVLITYSGELKEEGCMLFSYPKKNIRPEKLTSELKFDAFKSLLVFENCFDLNPQMFIKPLMEKQELVVADASRTTPLVEKMARQAEQEMNNHNELLQQYDARFSSKQDTTAAIDELNSVVIKELQTNLAAHNHDDRYSLTVDLDTEFARYALNTHDHEGVTKYLKMETTVEHGLSLSVGQDGVAAKFLQRGDSLFAAPLAANGCDVTGTIKLATSVDFSQVAVGQIFVDAEGNQFPIKSFDSGLKTLAIDGKCAGTGTFTTSIHAPAYLQLNDTLKVANIAALEEDLTLHVNSKVRFNSNNNDPSSQRAGLELDYDLALGQATVAAVGNDDVNNEKTPLNMVGSMISLKTGTSVTNPVVIKDGKIGIGSANPTTAIDVVGTVTATSFIGDGSALTNVTAGGISDNAITSAKINDGTIVDLDINATAAITATKLGDGTVDNTELGYLNNVTSNVQTQITNRLVAANNLSEVIPATARTNLGLGSSAITNVGNGLQNNAGNLEVLAVDATISVGAGGVDIAADSLVNADINTAAAIAGTKISPDFGALTVQTTGLMAAGTLTADSLTTDTQKSLQVGPFGVAAGNTGEVRYLELAATGVNYVGFKAADSLAGDQIWTLPALDGTVGQILKTDGGGVLGWIDPPAAEADTLDTVTTRGPTTANPISVGVLTSTGLTVDTNTLYVDAAANKVGIGNLIPTTALEVTGTVTATAFSGNGAAVTGVTAVDISDDAITSAKIVNLAIMDADINATAGITATKLGAGTVDNTELGYIDGVTSNVQTQITNRLVAANNLSEVIPATARTNLGLGSSAITNVGNGLQNNTGNLEVLAVDATISVGAGGVDIAADSLVNADINTAAAIAGTKISPDFGALTVQTTGLMAAGTLTADSLTTDTQKSLQVGPFGVAAGNTGEVRYLELAATGVNYVGFKAADSLAGDQIWTLPTADGTVGQLLKTNGAGVLGWIDAGAEADTLNTVTGRGATTANAISVGVVTSTGLVVDTATLSVDTTNDRVGVGTLTPATTLDVVGTITATNFSGIGTAVTNVTAVDIDNDTITSAKIIDLAIMNADINASAAIAGSKISPDFGAQTVQTTGSVTSGSLTVDTNTLSVDAVNDRVGIGTATPGEALDVVGSVKVTVSYLTAGADYAEYFQAEETLVAGEVVGLNPRTGLVRGYQIGDKLIGVVSTKAGVIGNTGIKDEKSVIVALVGQVPFIKEKVRVKNSTVYTPDGMQIGYLLASGNVYLKMSAAKEYQGLQQRRGDNQNVKPGIGNNIGINTFVSTGDGGANTGLAYCSQDRANAVCIAAWDKDGNPISCDIVTDTDTRVAKFLCVSP